MRAYYTPKHVHVCRTDDGIVFLDLRRGNYFGLADQQAQLLSGFVQGWPSARPMALNAEATGEAIAVAEALVEQKLLTTDPSQGKTADPIAIRLAEASVMERPGGARPGITLRDIARFIAACSAAALKLRCCSLETIVKRVKRRKDRACTQFGRQNGDVRQLVAIFRYLRTFVFSSKDACLFDSLTLVEFLSRYEVFPTWVLGVHTRPFGAHSWVQQDATVLNDSVQNANNFTPLLAI